MAAEILINATAAKYVKLGKKGAWEDLCLNEGTLRLGYYEVPHEWAASGDKESIRGLYLKNGASQSAATNHARQVLDFYRADADTIWVTFSRGFLWWCQAKPDVEFIGQDKNIHLEGSRLRRCISRWSNKSVTGQELHLSDLSGRLTRCAGYQGTLCEIRGTALEYLLRKINGQDLPAVVEAKAARAALEDKTKELIRLLTWQDFELFVDILFSKSGWIRVSQAGKTMKDIDFELVLPITGERALVQIKSSTAQAELDECAETRRPTHPTGCSTSIISRRICSTTGMTIFT